MSTSMKLQVEWLVENDRDIIVGPVPKTVLQVEARQDLLIKTWRILFPQPERLDAWCECVQVLPITGRRHLPSQHLSGSRRLIARQDIPPMIFEAEGVPVEPLAWLAVRDPQDYWQFAGTVPLWNGQCVGLVVRTRSPTICRAMMGGK